MLAAQVGLVHATEGTGALVQRITRSYWNHCVVHVGKGLCVSAEPHGARLRLISHYDTIVWSQLPLTRTQRHQVVDWAIDHLDTPYNWVDYYTIGLTFATARASTPRWLQRWAASTEALICSQLANRALQAAGINLFAGQAVWPGSFGRYFYDQGWAPLP